MSNDKASSLLQSIEKKNGLWALLSLISGIIIGISGTVATQKFFIKASIGHVDSKIVYIDSNSSVKASNIGDRNILSYSNNQECKKPDL